MTIYGGDFEKREQIGKGGMAWVFKGWQLSLNRPAAIKIMYPHLAEDEGLRRRFLQEGFNAANMKHGNIVHVYRAGDEGGEPYIAMEFIDGLNLHHWLDRYGQLPIEIAMIAFRDICRGLEHAHERNVIHRDIKPSNVMLSREGIVKLMDFGLARRLDYEGLLTAPGTFLGTESYMSPEQAARQETTAASDIFSLGIVGYELLSGERPFQGESPSEVSRQIQVGDPPPLGRLNPLVPERLAQTIHQMLAKSPERRFRSVAEIIQQVDEAIEGLDIRRDQVLLREYARDPDGVSGRLRKERLTRCLNQALFLESQGLDRIDDAIRAFGQVLALDPANELAFKRHQALVDARTKRHPDQETEVLPPHDPIAKPSGRRSLPVGRLALAAIGVAIGFVGWKYWTPVYSLFRGQPASFVQVAPVPVPPATTSSISVDTSPSGGLITLGSETPRKAPALFESLPPGEYPYAAILNGYEPISGKLVLVVGRDTSLILPLTRVVAATVPGKQKPSLGAQHAVDTTRATAPPVAAPARMGLLRITATPAPQYWIDGAPKGSGIDAFELRVPEGLHDVRLDHRNYAIKNFTGVRVGPDSTTNLHWDFEQHASRVEVRKIGPYWGWIILDGKDLKLQTPQVIPVRPGPHTIRVVHEGYTVEPAELPINIGPEETLQVSFEVIPE